MLTTLVGLLLAVIIGLATFGSGQITFDQLRDNLGLLIVIGGTVSASFITFTIRELLNLLTDLSKVMRKKRDDEAVIIKQIIKAAESYSQRKSPGPEAHPFVLDGVKLLLNDFDEDGIRFIMSQSIIERRDRHLKSVEMLKTMAKYPSAFGMMGTVLGLVSLLNGLSTQQGVKGIGPSMSVALLTTLYGLIITNWIFHPISENLLLNSEHDIQIRKMIMQGILLIRKGHDVVFIQEALSSYLRPASRQRLNLLIAQ